MPSGRSHSRRRLSESDENEIDSICDRFEAGWKNQHQSSIEQELSKSEEPVRSALLYELLLIDFAYRKEVGEAPCLKEYLDQFHEHADVVAAAFANFEWRGTDSNLAGNAESSTRDAASNNDSQLILPVQTLPERIDRYRISELIGAGGFGLVYRGYDERLKRDVAIKVPRDDPTPDSVHLQNYLAEARMAAGLEHPNIVEVYDADETEDGRFFIASRFIDGMDLKKFAQQNRPSYRDVAAMLAKVADALQHAHSRKLIHRDIKPSNILVDSSGEPYLADFGLALSDEEFGRETNVGGTLAYMSPEQARGEGHLVDGRSDIFSLGVVLYELLTEERPFSGSSQRELLERIKHQDARPPRQLVGEIPKELERICLKALSKRASDRYSAAIDLAEDLRHYLRGARNRKSKARVAKAPVPESVPDGAPARVVPKGLRSFDQMDSDFFLQLIPGPRDRYGLPECIRFWKSHIERLDGDNTFRVGVIYGPSGCGKTSFVKAGLLPRLAGFVHGVYIEANGTDDEDRLLNRLHRQHRVLNPSLDLVQTITSLRRGRGIPDAKTLIVLDQFEQWLHAKTPQEREGLISALRQCDGEHVQCLLLVRDDFWMAVSRFMGELDTRLIEGQNSASIDLFDSLHAQRVLADFGRAYGRLPEFECMTKEQSAFLEQAVAGLTRKDRVIPVRLAVFAEMMKGKAWTPGQLRLFGGPHGVTTTFLEDTFSSETAPPEHRRHIRAAQRVLRELLPTGHAVIKGQFKSHTQLLDASEYQDNPQAFGDLMRILDNETRLLTPVEPDTALEQTEKETVASAERYYHLTHDYLVQPLREWLNRKQRETRRGRAELMLDERANLWNVRRERKQLPSQWEWLTILLLVPRRNWSRTHSKMMGSAATFHVARVVGIMLLMGTVTAGVWAWKYRRDGIVGAAVAQARTAWREGKETAAFKSFEIAREVDSGHKILTQLKRELSTEGGATIEIVPPTLGLEITADFDAGPKLGLDWNPKVLSSRTHFDSGQHVRLAIGHYNVSVFRQSEVVARFPLFVDQAQLDLATQKRQWLGPDGDNLPASNGTISVADQLRLRLAIPENIPRKLVYVNPGPMWRSNSPRLEQESETIEAPGPTSNSTVEVGIHDGTGVSLVHDDLGYGLLVAKGETSVADFSSWWGDDEEGMGSQYCDWRRERATRVLEAVRETRDVPRDVHMRCWAAELEAKGVQASDLTASEIISVVFEELQEFQRAGWQKYEERTLQRIKERLAEDGDVPFTASWRTAIAYARTHARIDLPHFKHWIEERVQDAHYFASALESLSSKIATKPGRFVDPESELSQTSLVRDMLGPIVTNELPLPVLDAYCYWLKIRTFYGWQVPIEHILETKKSDSSEPQLRPETWLWRKGGSSLYMRDSSGCPPRSDVDSYADALSRGEVKPLREHLLRWLTWMIGCEESEAEHYGRLLSQFKNATPDELNKIPFNVRYRYGTHQGWDIPTWIEWEKAYRGADYRTVPWGRAGSFRNAWVDSWGVGSRGPLPEIGATSTVGDESPYGVLHMAGNVSEWVRPTQPLQRVMSPDGGYRMEPIRTGWNATSPARAFLKGGNYVMKPQYCRASYMLSLSRRGAWVSEGVEETLWTGFRVVRRIQEYRMRP